jgi:hypothetical protein
MTEETKPRKKTGGRKKGTKNRRNQSLKDRLDAMGCDPIEGMAKIAMDKANDMSHRVTCYKELAQYIAPKKKAVEVTGDLSVEHSTLNVIIAPQKD